MRVCRFAMLLAALSASACTAVGERTQLSVGYYSIYGRTFSELDQQVALHGPVVAGVGKALAATNVRMVPDFEFAFDGDKCTVTSAHVAVKAHVTLPLLANPEEIRRDLSKAWNNLEQYARLHESVHVAIADRHALRAEKIISSLPPESDCRTLRGNAMLTFRKLMTEHEHEQIQFDEDERERISMLVSVTRKGEPMFTQ